MTNQIHTIQSSDKKEFDKQVNQLLELGGELMDGGYQVINTDDGVVYSQVIVFKNFEEKFSDWEQLKLDGNEKLETHRYPNGQKMEEFFNKDGEKLIYNSWDENGKIMIKNGNGLYIGRDEDGKKRYEGTYKDGKKDGLQTWWGRDGHKKEKTFKDEKQVGLETHWYPNGQKRHEGTWKDGKPDGLHTGWFEDGKKRSEVTYKDGKRDGLRTCWYKNGQKMYVKTFMDGEQVGLETRWYPNGQKGWELTFKDGKYIIKNKWNEDGSVKE
jgi:antitoxin component YwqK of YwqJK toxin-antitoxin module